MTKPPPRASLPQRSSQNTKRRLDQAAAPAEIDARFVGIRYVGSPKHKRHPHLFNLEL